MKMAVWSAVGVFAVTIFAIGLLGRLVKAFMNQSVRQMLSKMLSNSRGS
ncbi:hypothetical protein ACVMB0_007502 [Bradyrhizobium sp. USDA 4451]